MSCIVQCVCINGEDRNTVVRGGQPKRSMTWQAKAWLILAGGEKHTHSITVPRQTIQSLIPYMGALIDGLIAEHGNVVEQAGWSAAAHGRK